MSGPIRTQNDLDQLGATGSSSLYPGRLKILIGSATCGIAAGAKAVETAAVEAVKRLGLDAVVARTGCIGFCQREPLLDLILPDGPRISYGNMTANKTTELLEAYAAGHDLKAKSALCRFDGEDHVATGEAPCLSSSEERGRLDSCLVRRGLLSPPEPRHSSQLRFDRSALAGRGHRPRRLPRSDAGADEPGARRGDRRSLEVGPPRPWRRRFPHRPQVADRPTGRVGRQVCHL